VTDDQIPTDGEHRGVPFHAGQSEARLRKVRRDIDTVHRISDIDALVAFAGDAGNAPESRIFARAKALAILDDAVERRAPRSRTAVIDRQYVKALAAGCDSITWRCRTHYASNLDVRQPGQDRRVPREIPLPDRWAKNGE
jgi:hypothetical protein